MGEVHYLRISLSILRGVSLEVPLGVTAHTGGQVAEMFGLAPKAVVDASGRPACRSRRKII